jgi:hypothetical protein
MFKYLSGGFMMEIKITGSLKNKNAYLQKFWVTLWLNQKPFFYNNRFKFPPLGDGGKFPFRG